MYSMAENVIYNNCKVLNDNPDLEAFYKLPGLNGVYQDYGKKQVIIKVEGQMWNAWISAIDALSGLEKATVKLADELKKLDEIELKLNTYNLKLIWEPEYIKQLKDEVVSIAEAFLSPRLSVVFSEMNENKKRSQYLWETGKWHEVLEMYQKASDTTKILERMSDTNESLSFIFKEYLLHYKNIAVLMSAKLNHLNRNPHRKRFIAHKAYVDAMTYVYEVSNIAETGRIVRERILLQKKKKALWAEQQVIHELSFLESDGYVNITARSTGKTQERCILLKGDNSPMAQQIDIVLVTPDAKVIAIEVKKISAANLKILPDAQWIRTTSNGSNGTLEITGEKNPESQTIRHEQVLRDILGDVEIHSIICIANPSIIIEGAENSSIPVLRSDVLLGYIKRNFGTGKGSVSADVEGIVEKINAHMV